MESFVCSFHRTHSPLSRETRALTRNHAKATRITVAPVAVRAQSWADSISPATAEVTLTSIAHQNMVPAERAKFRAVDAVTISIAVTRKTPTAQTEKITINDKRPANVY